MPIYEFECKDCGEVFEIIKLKSEEEPVASCKHCGSEKTERKLSSFSTSGCLKTSCQSAGPSCTSTGGG